MTALGQRLDSREVEPEMSEIIVLAKEDLALPPGHRVAENVTVTAPFQDQTSVNWRNLNSPSLVELSAAPPSG